VPDSRAPLFVFGKNLFWLFFRLYNRWQVTGRENVPREGGILIIANHTSYADPPIVGSCFPRPVNFMAKSELFFFPLGPIIRGTHAFPVKRGGGEREALRTAIRMLKEGRVLLIFPEGTRSPEGRLIDFEPGAAFVALNSGAHVVPVGLDGADRLLPLHATLPRPAKLRIQIGPPVNLDDLRGQRASREVLEEATARMAAAMREVLPKERWPREGERPETAD
jgi:1-acyl-sn-glycerol-3-phosphate acyltransferase